MKTFVALVNLIGLICVPRAVAGGDLHYEYDGKGADVRIVDGSGRLVRRCSVKAEEDTSSESEVKHVRRFSTVSPGGKYWLQRQHTWDSKYAEPGDAGDVYVRVRDVQYGKVCEGSLIYPVDGPYGISPDGRWIHAEAGELMRIWGRDLKIYMEIPDTYYPDHSTLTWFEGDRAFYGVAKKWRDQGYRECYVTCIDLIKRLVRVAEIPVIAQGQRNWRWDGVSSEVQIEGKSDRYPLMCPPDEYFVNFKEGYWQASPCGDYLLGYSGIYNPDGSLRYSFPFRNSKVLILGLKFVLVVELANADPRYPILFLLDTQKGMIGIHHLKLSTYPPGLESLDVTTQVSEKAATNRGNWSINDAAESVTLRIGDSSQVIEVPFSQFAWKSVGEK